MAAADQLDSRIIFYDISSRTPNRAWSPNTWKTRFVLNYKKIKYDTHWLEYPDIAPTLKAANVTPNDASTAPWPYTLPAVRLSRSEYVMDSKKIAEKLDTLFPKPSLYLDSSYIPLVEIVFEDLLAATNVLYLAGVPEKLLTPASEDYFRKDREQMLGMDIRSYATQDRRDKALRDAKSHMVRLALLLRENEEGPFLMGKQVSYADFIIASWLVFFDRLDILDHMIIADPVPFQSLYAACKPWMAEASE